MQGNRGNYPTMLAAILSLTAMVSATAASNRLPRGWKAEDVIGPAQPGETRIIGTGENAVWKITGTGDTIWHGSDQFQYAHTTLRGDGGITARLLNVTGGNPDGWAKVGVMLRENTEAGSRCAFMTYANGGVFEPTWRLGTNLTPSKRDEDTNGAGRPLGDRPIWIRSQRRGQTYEHLLSEDGHRWEFFRSMKVPIPADKPVLVGLSACMHGGNPPVVAEFDHVSVGPDLV